MVFPSLHLNFRNEFLFPVIGTSFSYGEFSWTPPCSKPNGSYSSSNLFSISSPKLMTYGEGSYGSFLISSLQPIQACITTYSYHYISYILDRVYLFSPRVPSYGTGTRQVKLHISTYPRYKMIFT